MWEENVAALEADSGRGKGSGPHLQLQVPAKGGSILPRVNRMADDRLWDDAGREWQRLETGLSRERAAQLLSNPAVRVGVHDDFGRPLRWVDSTEREAVWRNQVEPEFAKPKIRAGHFSKTRYSMTRLFEASLWGSGPDEIVIFGWD